MALAATWSQEIPFSISLPSVCLTVVQVRNEPVPRGVITGDRHASGRVAESGEDEERVPERLERLERAGHLVPRAGGGRRPVLHVNAVGDVEVEQTRRAGLLAGSSERAARGDALEERQSQHGAQRRRGKARREEVGVSPWARRAGTLGRAARTSRRRRPRKLRNSFQYFMIYFSPYCRWQVSWRLTSEPGQR